ncbi:ATP-binding protein [Gemmatimonas groenlandica]|uniref:Uncharacterized protein n=1 Tax=Gemmatimonas groenlandica TaxID=2732249 RepID=A0A6M4ISL1_9BACT|nr:ATP-binding protein [Gemmatimonas groenlandica]QJR35221.1 hypothetical protein HKW67_06740 [Gemmatimonas groenlandica]
MTVANIAFLLDRLAADTPPNQQIRELTQNAIEAVVRRQKAGEGGEGLIRWDVDWEHLARTDTFKLCIVDNGDGMTPEQMSSYLNSLAVQGANQTQSISENFGVGAKITALFRNSLGLVYQSWRDGRGTMVKLHRDDSIGQYGLDSFDLADGPHWTPRIKDVNRPRGIEDSGTKVTLLGVSDEGNTCVPPETGGMNWLVTYLTSRYFRLPANLKLQVRVLTKDVERWPKGEPSPSEKTFNLQTIRGTKHLFDEYSSAHGTVHLSNADAHWWVFDDPAKSSKEMSSRGSRTGQAGIVFQDEVYVLRTPPSSRRILAGFGVLFGAEHVIIYIEPRGGTTGLDLRADTARSRVLINGEDVEEANWWERWGAEFRTQLPAEIRAKIDEIMARSNSDPHGKLRERILERLKRIRDFLRPSRYRKSASGVVLAAGSVRGGAAGSDGELSEPRSHRLSGSRGGRASDDYLADLVESGGDEAVPVLAQPREPEVLWVTLGKGREDGEMEDVAAEIAGDALNSSTIKANADFRGYRDVLSHFALVFNPNADLEIERLIVDYVQEWMGLQLVEAVMTIRNLANGRTWTGVELQQALSPYALTSVMMARFHVIERVARSLKTDLARVVTKVQH